MEINLTTFSLGRTRVGIFKLQNCKQLTHFLSKNLKMILPMQSTFTLVS